MICSLELLRKKRRLDQALDADWDLMVVDEAITWSGPKRLRAAPIR